MAKKAYIGIDGVARRIKGGYIGVDGVARKIKKAYIGIGGVARPCIGVGITYYGEIEPLTEFRGSSSHLGVTNGSYAIITGDINSGDVNYAYDTSLSQIRLSGFTFLNTNLAGTVIGQYALFAGSHRNYVIGYDKSLTMIRADYLDKETSELAATTIGEYALFAGGYDDVRLDTVYVYNSSLTREASINLSVPRADAAAGNIGNYAIFAGGSITSGSQGIMSSTADAFNTWLTRQSVADLSTARPCAGSATVGDYVIFIGGNNGNYSYFDDVDVYNVDLIRTTLSPTGYAGHCSGTSLGGYALLSAVNDSIVITYDADLTMEVLGNLMAYRQQKMAATTIGEYALFAGGYSKSVEAYTM